MPFSWSCLSCTYANNVWPLSQTETQKLFNPVMCWMTVRLRATILLTAVTKWEWTDDAEIIQPSAAQYLSFFSLKKNILTSCLQFGAYVGCEDPENPITAIQLSHIVLPFGARLDHRHWLFRLVRLFLVLLGRWSTPVAGGSQLQRLPVVP